MKKELKKKIDEIIRVNHAGEFGAQVIYGTQIKFTRDKKLKKKLIEIAEDEQRHFDYFNEKMIDYRARPTLMSPIWKLGGTMLGALTAKLGEKYVHACTESVEQVIVDHYKNQMEYLKKNKTNDDLLKKIKQFCDEEDEHRQDAKDSRIENDLKVKLFKKFTSKLTSLAIEVSKKV